jgi:hypothetical protein
MSAQPVEERTPVAVIEDLAFLADHGVGATEAARRTGFSCVKTLDKWLRRHDQVPLLNQLTRQNYAALTTNGPTRHLRSAP